MVETIAMSRKKILLVTLFFFLIVGMSYVATLDSSNKVKETLSTANSFSSLVTLLIALVLFNKYGIENNLLERKLKIISDIFDHLSKVNFTLHIKGPKGEEYHFISVLSDLRRNHFRELDMYGHFLVLADISSISAMSELRALGENIFLPADIAKAIEKIPGRSLSHTKVWKEQFKRQGLNNYVTLTFPGTNKEIYDPNLGKMVISTEIGLLDGRDINLSEYLLHYEEIYNTCQKWLKENSSISLDLNS